MTTYEVLEKALALIEDEKNWRQGGFGFGREGGPYCALEACCLIQEDRDVSSPASKLRRSLIDAGFSCSVADFNDSHTHAEVIALFQKVIAQEKAKAGIYVEIPEKVAEHV